jgi:hypothetical protein
MRVRHLSLLIAWVALVLICAQLGMAVKDGHLVVHVYPKQAYVYADGEPIVESLGHFITLSPGEHRIDLYNYGYKPETRNVTVTSHKTLHLAVTMQPIPGVISGPWGCITLEHADRAAVLLNGTEPAAFFVGHGDEFNNEFGPWKQELIVPPGKHQLTVEYLNHDPWTTTVEVQANQRVVVDAYKGVRKTVAWTRGEQLKEEPHFRGGLASTAVVVAKVSGEFAASTGQVNCGEPAHLTWSSNGAAKTELNGAPVSASGDQTVQPKGNTTYKFTAAGPGGVYTSDATVNVNNAISASLSVSPTDVVFQNGDHQSTARVTWSAPGADSVTLDPLGPVGATGSRDIQVTPTKTEAGPIDQNITYTLHATNACGGSETRTASLHLTGSNGVLQGAANPPAEPQAEAPQQIAENTPPPRMPHTASQLPLVGLIGILSLAAAVSFRILLKIWG